MNNNSSINNREIYNKNWPEWVDMKKYGPSSCWLRLLIDSLFAEFDSKVCSVRSVLDVGCGEGTNTRHLAQRFSQARVVGIDFSETAITLAQNSATSDRLSFLHDPKNQQLLNHYDLVSCLEVLEHVPDWQGLVKQLAASSQRFLLLSFPTGRMRAHEKIVGHVRNFLKGEVEAFLTQQGFKPLKFFYAGFPFFSPLYREFCNLTNAGNNSFARGKFTAKQKILSRLLLFCFQRLSTRQRWGDQFVGLFEREQVKS